MGMAGLCVKGTRHYFKRSGNITRTKTNPWSYSHLMRSVVPMRSVKSVARRTTLPNRPALVARPYPIPSTTTDICVRPLCVKIELLLFESGTTEH